MQYVKPYYAIDMALRYYGHLPESIRIEELDRSVCGKLGQMMVDVQRWKDPAHECLANVRRDEEGVCDPHGIEAFLRRYGPLMGRTGVTTSDFSEGWYQFTYCQEILQKAWKKDAACLIEIEAQLEVLDVIKTKMESGRFVLETLNLWTYLCFFFMRDFSAGKAKVCESPDCSTPYFIEQRRGQKYCSHVCAVRENVRRFRRTESKARQQEAPRKKRERRGNGATKTW
jgi:predicted nucleic acid-binding Zn finger protein